MHLTFLYILSSATMCCFLGLAIMILHMNYYNYLASLILLSSPCSLFSKGNKNDFLQNVCQITPFTDSWNQKVSQSSELYVSFALPAPLFFFCCCNYLHVIPALPQSPCRFFNCVLTHSEAFFTPMPPLPDAFMTAVASQQVSCSPFHPLLIKV